MNIWFIFVCLALLGYCFALTKYARFSIEVTPFFVISSLIVLLYIFAYANFLQIGTLIILIMGFLLFCYTPVFLWKDKQILFQKYLTPGFSLGLLVCILSVLFAKPILTGWDAYAFWGPLAKFMAINHGLIHPETIVSHKVYPPGGRLFYYPFMWFKFNEINLLRAQQLLLWAPLLVMVQKIPWKKWYSIVSYTILGFILVYFFMKMMLHASLHDWTTIYMDFPVSVFFASIIIYYQMSDKVCRDILQLLPCLFALLLLKAQLLPFSLIIIVLIGVDQLVLGIFGVQVCLAKNTSHLKTRMHVIKQHRPVISRCIIRIIFLFVISLIAVYTWKFYATNINAKHALNLSHVSLHQIINVLTLQKATPAQITCLHSFLNIVWRPLLDSVVFLIVALMIAKWQTVKKLRYSIAIENIILFLGSLAYLFGLLLLYLFAFSDIEKQYLASFNRYVTIYYFAWLLVLYNTLFHKVLKHKAKFMQFKVQVIFIPIAIFVIIASAYQANNFVHNKQMRFRRSFDQIGKAVKQHIPLQASSKVFIVWQNTSGMPLCYLRYILMPISIQSRDSSIGQPYAGRKHYSQDFTTPQFLQKLSKYDYVLLAYTDQQFWTAYGHIFNLQPPQLKPLMSYEGCFGSSAFDPMMQPLFVKHQNCTIRQENVYLLKVMHHHNSVTFQNII